MDAMSPAFFPDLCLLGVGGNIPETATVHLLSLFFPIVQYFVTLLMACNTNKASR